MEQLQRDAFAVQRNLDDLDLAAFKRTQLDGRVVLVEEDFACLDVPTPCRRSDRLQRVGVESLKNVELAQIQRHEWLASFAPRSGHAPSQRRLEG